MILGIGVDLIDIRRVQHLIDRFNNHFLNKYFTSSEISFCNNRQQRVASFSKIFSIKEAIIKAISDKSGMSWHTLEILHDNYGKPIAKINCNKFGLIPNNNIKVHVTTSDEPPYVISMAVIEQL